ncbi:MAG: hypothetical protein H0V96_05705 [Acidimicrobiia bacterium]|nr:hypothetical protein [Acidimicrobiia bacterium]
MQFPKRFWPGLEDGSVTVAVRRWRRPSVRADGTMQSKGGLLGIDSVDIVAAGDVTEEDARNAGYADRAELMAALARFTEGDLYRIRFHRIGEDPRAALRRDADLFADDVVAITDRLDRLDRASSHGPWTRQALDLIERHPERRAPDLAEMVGRETLPFKVDIRKLKALGLTESLTVGYRLSPRGMAYLAAAKGQRGRPVVGNRIAEPKLPLLESGQPDLADEADEALGGFGEP